MQMIDMESAIKCTKKENNPKNFEKIAILHPLQLYVILTEIASKYQKLETPTFLFPLVWFSDLRYANDGQGQPYQMHQEWKQSKNFEKITILHPSFSSINT